MKKLLIISALLLTLGITGCMHEAEEAPVVEEEAVLQEMETSAEEILEEEAIIEEALMELEAEEF